jgi:hypothetical protein
MSRAVLATLLFTACAFNPGRLPDPTETPDAAVPVAQGDAYQMNTCHSQVPGVQLCLDFEESNLAHDSTGLPYSIDVQGVQTTTRAGQQAAMLDERSQISIFSVFPLDTGGPMSMEMWVNPAAVAPNQPEAFLVSRMYAYGFSLANGQLFCALTAQGGMGGVDLGSNVLVTPGQWTHVACVFDGVTVKLFVNGAGAGCKKQPMTIETDVAPGVDLGFALVGGLDDIHLYSTALSDAEVCTLAGGTGCAPSKCD